MALEIKKIDKFIYPGTHRETIEGKRHYVVGEEKLPSVTTILTATQSEEKRKKLAEWRAREGAKKADEIKQRAANRGSTMHKILEHKILGQMQLLISNRQTSQNKENGYQITSHKVLRIVWHMTQYMVRT